MAFAPGRDPEEMSEAVTGHDASGDREVGRLGIFHPDDVVAAIDMMNLT